ncbi:MAG: mechanosensitive ion channel family protein [Methanoregula sp.]|nr:mechanosensitive ion channel family protein [Methanoregula sp.]
MDFSTLGINYVYALVTVILGVVLALIVRGFVTWLKGKAGKTDTQIDDIIIAAIGTPVQVAIIAISLYIASTYFGVIPPEYRWILQTKYVTAFYIFISAWIISTFLHDLIKIYGYRFAEKSKGDTDDRLIGLLVLVIKYVIWFIAIMAILSVFEIDITPFLAGAGILGLAVAFAAQDIISNFFGGAIITIDKPFRVGDRIKVDTYYGDVISIGPRSTRLKTLDYQIVTIPNNKITTNVIVNYAEPDQKMRIALPISVAYGTDPQKIKKILLEIASEVIKNTEYLIEDPAPKAFFTEFSDSSLNFILYVWAKKYNLPDEVRDAVNSRISDRFAAEGIEIPFPQMEVRVKK